MTKNHSLPIDEILKKRRVIVTCGTGGVGKTTLSAALALRASLLGRKAVVITIDPAKRLATSLGLESLGDHPTDLTSHLEKAAAQASVDLATRFGSAKLGSFAAIIPDTRRTFEAFVADLMPTPQGAEKMMRNPIFHIFAREFSGTNEYMALQRLYALDTRNEYDLIVLDTPPSRNTLAFLNAPTLLARFFDDKIIHWLAAPAQHLLGGGMKKVLGLLEKLTGENFMTYLIEFASMLFEVREPFIRNVKHVTHLLQSPELGFLLVANPRPDTTDELRHFVSSIQEHGFHFNGIALNRTLGYLEPAADEREKLLADPSLKPGYEILNALQQREEASIASLQKQFEESLVYAKLPELARDVHSVEDLFHVAMAFDAARQD